MAIKIKRRDKADLELVASIGIDSCKVAAKVASDESKPDGLTEVPPGEEAKFLAALEIGKMPGVGKKTEEALSRLGIRTIDDLARTRKEAVKMRFGAFGELLCDYAIGANNMEVLPLGKAKSISRKTTFQEDTWDRAFLSAILRHQAEEAGAELRESKKQAKCIGIKVWYADFTTITRHCTLLQVNDADQTIFEVGLDFISKGHGC